MSLEWKRQRPRIVALVLLASAAFFAMRIANARGNARGSSAASEAKPSPSGRTAAANKLALYAGVGNEVVQYDVDVEHDTLVEAGSLSLPGTIGEGWIHPSNKFVYVPWSDSARHSSGVTPFRVDLSSGVLTPNGQPVPLRSSASYVTGDIPGTHLLVSYGNPAGIGVFRIGADGTIDSQVEQPGSLDLGNFAHQVRVVPSNKSVILVTRGTYTDEQYPNQDSPRGLKILTPGALKVFRYNDGVLANQASVTENGGFGFQSRHLDFHPSGRWLYLTLEPQNKLYVYKVSDDGSLSPHPLFMKETLADPGNVRPMQHAGTVHVHPNGKFVYVANRTNGTRDFDGHPVFAGGENSIAVYAINETTGEPTAIQHIDTQGILPRTFAIDPSGRMLVVAHQTAFAVRDGNSIRTIPCTLAVFRIGPDGKLTFVSKYDLKTGGDSMTWSSPQGFTQGKSVSWVALVPLS